MTEPEPTAEPTGTPAPNNALRFFFITGPLLAIAGLVAAVLAANAVRSQATVDGYTNVLEGGSPYDTIPVNYTAVWIWGLVGLIGVVLLIVGIAIRAARPNP